ncbi:MAG: ABC transporter permease [Chitinophagaceae bacterium]
MIKNYLKTAWRNLVKDRMHSTINILGLAMGMTVALLIGLWMYDEISFNKNFDRHERIAQVVQNVTNNGKVQTWESVPYPLAEELRKNYGSDFKHIVMAVNQGEYVLQIDDKKIKSNGGFFEKEMPELFSLTMISGQRSALADPSSILLSESTARACFGDEDPMGRMLKINKMEPVKVAGIYKDLPANSSLASIRFVASWDFWYHSNDNLKDMEDPWRPNFTTLYAELNENTGMAAVSARIKDAKLKKVNAQLQQKKPALFLQPMDNWHLYSEFKDGINTGGAIKYVRMFGIIGIFVLLLACINFMNLSTARSEKRAREVGIRKTVGSLRRQLITQFFTESLLTVTLAFIISLVLAWLALPYFNQIAGKQMQMPLNKPVFWMSSAGFIFLTALIAGSYPAIYLSSFRPVKVLKGTFKARLAAIPRKVLVVLQFSVSAALIVGTMIVYRQIQFGKDRPVGYTRANLITVGISEAAIHNHFTTIKNELLQTGAILSVAESESPTTGVWNTTSGFSWPGKAPDLSTDFGVVAGSHDFGKTIGWEIKEGRDFNSSLATDSSAIILNEAAVSYMNLKNPVGQTVTWWGRPLTVIGITKNMVIESPYDEVRPIIYPILDYQGNMLIIKLNPAQSVAESVKKIEPIFRKYAPEQPFEYGFVDDSYASKFGNEERIGKLSGIFTALAVIISCLGLFGLTSFVAEQRKKEIGIRKVLGASVFSVWNLLTREFVILVLIAFFIAFPLAYYFMVEWLQNYSYRTSLSGWVFFAAGAGVLLITALTVSFQAIKAAFANPVKSLRTE